MTAAELSGVFCEELVKQELDDTTPFFEIPREIREFYKMYRPSPLVRAYCLEKKLGTPAKITMATPLRWELRASADLLPQSCSMKNGKYIQYSRIFHTFTRVKTLAESPCPIMRCCPRSATLRL